MERDEARHDVLLELAELAPLQALAPDEQGRLAEHLAEGCAACEERYTLGARALDGLALAAPTVAPAPGRRAELLAAIDPPGARRQRGAGWRERRPVALAALAAGLALVLGLGFAVSSWRAWRAAESATRLARAQIHQLLAERDQRLDALSERLARFEHALAAGEAGVRALTLAGEASFGGTSARVVVDPAGHQVLLLASRLPPPPPGHTYQLWVIESGAPRSLGVFDPDAAGRVLHVESDPLRLSREFRVAVSVEPSGGVPQPTGPIVLVSH
jgi:anti-sigma-K factor RskA